MRPAQKSMIMEWCTMMVPVMYVGVVVQNVEHWRMRFCWEAHITSKVNMGQLKSLGFKYMYFRNQPMIFFLSSMEQIVKWRLCPSVHGTFQTVFRPCLQTWLVLSHFLWMLQHSLGEEATQRCGTNVCSRRRAFDCLGNGGRIWIHQRFLEVDNYM